MQTDEHKGVLGWRRPAVGKLLPGLWVALVIAFAATFVAEHSGGPQLLYALFFGIAFHFLVAHPKSAPGIHFASRTLLRIGIAFLGVRITLWQMANLGWWPIVIVCVGVAATLLFGLLCARLMGRTQIEGWLSGGAVAICGASAALAICSVLPKSQDTDRFTLINVVGVTTLSTLAMIFYPPLALWIGLTPEQTGIFLGATIHDVAQVVGAGYMVSPATGNVATFVKLLRVTLLVPVVLSISLAYHTPGTAGHAGERVPLVPLFLVGFTVLLLANSFGLVPAAVHGSLDSFSRWCLVTAIAAIGIQTSFQDLAKVGWRAVAVLVVTTMFLAGLVLALLRFT
jgi:uncharacterized integral membrane protein (TIGR00698 family)